MCYLKNIILARHSFCSRKKQFKKYLDMEDEMRKDETNEDMASQKTAWRHNSSQADIRYRPSYLSGNTYDIVMDCNLNMQRVFLIKYDY